MVRYTLERDGLILYSYIPFPHQDETLVCSYCKKLYRNHITMLYPPVRVPIYLGEDLYYAVMPVACYNLFRSTNNY